jgi:hypothetical protein
MPIRPNAFLQRRAIAIFTLLAMLVAPLCAPLCGSRTCANLAATQSDDCHGLAASDRAPGTGVAAIRVCGLQEFPAAALNESTSSPDRLKQDSALPAPSNFVLAQSAQRLVSDPCRSRPNDELRIASTSVQPTILRI